MGTKRKVRVSRYYLPPVAHCSRCDWSLEDVDSPKMSREARKHCASTGHTVRIDWNVTGKYELEPDSAAPGERQARSVN